MSQPDWLRLQKLIFARYVTQRLREGGIKRNVEDVVTEMADGTLLVELVEVMSGNKFDKKLKPTTMRIKMVNNVNEALAFVAKCGLDLVKIRVQAEDLIDLNEKVVLALVFAIISKYMKFEDEDDEASDSNVDVRDALVLWLKNKTDGYAGVDIKVKNGKLQTKGFTDGCVFLALVNKMRPKLIDYSTISPENGAANRELALDLGEKYLNIDKYITADDILKLDELSMIVYVSDWYMGVFLLMKQDIAARRVGKLVGITELHDKMRAEYSDKATAIKEWANAKTTALNLREFDDTLGGIKGLLETFYAYKGGEKADWGGKKLDSDGLFSNLALRLANNKRPAWVSPEGTSPQELDALLEALEQAETQRSVDLNIELARQVRLHKLNKNFVVNSDKLQAWVSEKQAYLENDEPMDNVEPAEEALETLGIYDKELRHKQDSQLVDIKALSTELVSERFELSADVTSKQSALEAGFAKLEEAATAKRARLEAELQKQKDLNDSLCSAFAEGAKSFTEWLSTLRNALTNSGDQPLNQQLADIKAQLADTSTAEGKLKALNEQDAKVQGRGIGVNPHTNLAYADVQAQWTQYVTLCTKMQTLLDEQIEEAKRGGLTPEQMAEISANFAYFDKDGSGFLNRKEIKGCLQSLGEESTPADINQLLEDYDADKNGTITAEEFERFMKKQMGDSGAEEQIVTSFKYLCYDKEHIVETELTNVVNDKTFKDQHVEYLKANMDAKDAGFDYTKWTKEAFER